MIALFAAELYIIKEVDRYLLIAGIDQFSGKIKNKTWTVL